MERILSLEEEMRKFFFEKHLDFWTSVPQRRMQEIIVASCAKRDSGKMTDYAEVFPAHRTTYGHFDTVLEKAPLETAAKQGQLIRHQN